MYSVAVAALALVSKKALIKTAKRKNHVFIKTSVNRLHQTLTLD
jgi:hypothetical protein